MKISFILPALYGTGGIDVVYEYAKRLADKEYDVKIYAPVIGYNMQRGAQSVDFLKQIYATIKTVKLFFFDKLPAKMSRIKNVSIKTVLMIRDKYIEDADCVIATAWCTAYDVDKLSNMKGKKFYFIQDYEVWDNKKLGEESYKLPLKKIVIAKWIKDRIENLGLDTSDIPVIYNGIDFDLYNISRSYNAKGRMHFLMLDHSLEKKGVNYGIRVFNKIKQKYPEVHLKMFGMKRSSFVPDYAEYYENPTRAELVNLYNESDIFLFPSIEEGWGLTVIEAMASGCAVVGTNTGCLLEIGKDKYNCMKSNPKDVDSMVENVIEIMENDKLFFKLIQQGKETAKNLDWNKSLAQFEKAISFLNIGY